MKPRRERLAAQALLKEAFKAGTLPKPPCYTCQYLVEYEGLPIAEVQRGIYPGFNGYAEYWLCNAHREGR